MSKAAQNMSDFLNSRKNNERFLEMEIRSLRFAMMDDGTPKIF